MVTDPDVRIRAQSVVLLGELGDPRAVKVLKRVFTSDPVSEVATAAEESLRALGALPPAEEMTVQPEGPPEPDGQGTFDQ
jgi:HEAT repeat protein